PISQTIAARLDGVYVKRDGFIKNSITGERVNDRDRWLLRGQLLFEPNSDLSFRLIADYAKRDETCCAATYLPASDFVAGGGGSYNSYSTFPQELRLNGTAGGLDWLVGTYFANVDLRVRDNLSYGSDYEKFSNCLLALSPATGLAFAFNPASSTCFNEPALA